MKNSTRLVGVCEVAPKLRNIDWACKFLGLPRQSVYALCRANSIPFTKIGRSIRFVEDELVNFVRAGGSLTTPQISTALHKNPRPICSGAALMDALFALFIEMAFTVARRADSDPITELLKLITAFFFPIFPEKTED